MPYPEIERLSPNRAEGGQQARGVLFHHSELSYQATIDLMLRPESRVSYHCLIEVTGERCTLVRDEDIAWHAGASEFLGLSRCNDFLLGLSFAGDTRLAPLTFDQLASALDWLEARWLRYGWNLGVMTDHRQVAPGRKEDLEPGQWAVLQEAIAARFGSEPTP